jgi:hypothetical protein
MKYKAYCSICRKLHQSEKDNYYIHHESCANALDNAAEEEAKKRGFKDYHEWYMKTPGLETYEWVKQWMKEYRNKYGN